MPLDKKTFLRFSLLVGGGVVLFWILENSHLAANVIALLWSVIFPFILGGMFAFVLNLPLTAIENRLFKNRFPRLKRLFSVILTVLLLLIFITVLTFLLVPQLISTVETLMADMPEYIQRIQMALQPYAHYVPELEAFLSDLDWKNIGESLFNWLRSGFGSFFTSAIGVASSVVSGATSFVIGLIFCFYLLFDKEHMAAQLRAMLKAYLPEKIYTKILEISSLTSHTFSRFISGQCLEALAVGTLFVIVLLVGGFDYALLIGVIIGCFSIIPIVGAFIGCFLGALLILISSGLLRTVAFIIVFLVIQQIDGNFMYPRIVGTSVGLPAMWVLVAISIGGGLMGVFGMLIFIPLFSVLYTLLRKNTAMRLQKRGLDSPMEEYYKKNPPPEKKVKKKKNKSS